MVEGVPKSLLPRLWGDSWEFLQRAIEHGGNRYNETSIRTACENGSMQLWAVTERGVMVGAGVSTVTDYPEKRVCTIFLAGGALKGHWGELEGTIAQFAKTQSCDEIEIIGRRGWLRALDGYESQHTMMSRPL